MFVKFCLSTHDVSVGESLGLMFEEMRETENGRDHCEYDIRSGVR